jgi:hypothetical protein
MKGIRWRLPAVFIATGVGDDLRHSRNASVGRAFPPHGGAWSAVIFTPPSMRAISPMRPSRSSTATADVVLPSRVFLGDGPLPVGLRRHLRQMGDAQHLALLPSCLSRRPTISATRPPMPTSTSSKISVPAPCLAGDDLDGQADARQLAARGNLGQRPQGLAGICADAELDAFQRRPGGAVRPVSRARPRTGRPAMASSCMPAVTALPRAPWPPCAQPCRQLLRLLAIGLPRLRSRSARASGSAAQDQFDRGAHPVSAAVRAVPRAPTRCLRAICVTASMRLSSSARRAGSSSSRSW